MKMCFVLCKLTVIEGVFHPAMHNHTLGKLYNLYFGETRCHRPVMHLITFSGKSTNLSLAPGSEEINPGKPKLGEPPSIIMNKSLIPSKSRTNMSKVLRTTTSPFVYDIGTCRGRGCLLCLMMEPTNIDVAKLQG